MHEPDSRGSPALASGLAIAVAFSCALGFLPKDSLAFYGVLAAALLLPVNILALATGAVVFHFVGTWSAPLVHKLGAILLTDPRLASVWVQIADWPVVPWTRFNNTRVMGAIVVSLILFWPLFLFSLALFARVVPPLRAAVARTAVYRWLQSDPAGELSP